jgi:hypothetical protein
MLGRRQEHVAGVFQALQGKKHGVCFGMRTLAARFRLHSQAPQPICYSGDENPGNQVRRERN